MNLIKGKFYDDGGNVIPLEFGNKKQIEVMQDALRQYNALTGDGLRLDVGFETNIIASCDFKCICGQTVWRETETDSEDRISDLGGIARCIKCKQEYKLEFDDDGELVATIVKK
jgi:hypothetical protein